MAAPALAARSSAGSGLLARMQQQFAEGKHTDVVIRVRVAPDEQEEDEQEDEQQPAPAAKRRRTTSAASVSSTAASAAAAAAAAADHYTDIKAHSLVLSSQSAYFDKALSGEWAEAAERRVELTVGSEQELEDLKLLIKLSYSDSYTHDDDGQLLPLATRLRLTVRADALEFVEAVDQLVLSLPLELSFEQAQTCLDDLLPAVANHVGIGAVRSEVIGVLVKGIEEREGKEDEEAAVVAGADALAQYLGPVVGMFEEGKDFVQLRDDVKRLPLCVLKRLLASEALDVQSENKTYSLLLAWLGQSPHVPAGGQQAHFNQLAPLLRYHHMSLDFIGNVVSQAAIVRDSSLLPAVMRSALCQRDVPQALLQTHPWGERVQCGGANRGVPPSVARYEMETSFSLEEVIAVEPGKVMRRACGVVAGYVGTLGVCRETKDGDTLGITFSLEMPGRHVYLQSGAEGGVGLYVVMALPPNVRSWVSSFCVTGWKLFDPFQKPWAEVVREGSPHFPDGKLRIKATVTMLTKE